MKKNINKILTALLVVPALALCFGFLVPAPKAMADDYVKISEGASQAKADDQAGSLFGSEGIFVKITNTALFLIGAVSVVMLIYGGIRYTVSGGESGAVTNAKNTILYAIVGIVVSVLAFAAVQFVIGQLTPAAS